MRVSKPPQERRAELVAAARQLFDERGVERTRVSDIVRQVGVAQGVFYYYFKSKDELVAEVVRQVSAELDEKAGAILQGGGSFCRRLAAFIHLFLDLIDQFLGDDETSLESLWGGGPGHTTLAGQSAHRLVLHLEALIRQGTESGEVTVRWPWESTQAAMYGLLGLSHRQLPDPQLICSITQRALGLPDGLLYKEYKQLAIPNKQGA